MRYIPRVVDREFRARLASAGAVVIEGARACGKTETARQAAATEVLLDIDPAAHDAVAVDPSLVLEGETPRLLDEWQVAPALWNHVRRAVDARREPGQFLLTGSSVPGDDESRHVGAGRFSFVRMRPMTLFESGFTNGAVSLEALMQGEPPRSTDPGLTVRDLADRIAAGGWPAQHGQPVARATRAARDYLEQIRQVDMSRVAGGKRDPAKVGALLRSLARNVSTEVGDSVLAADVAGGEQRLSRNTVSDYLTVLQRLMIVEDQPAWAPHLRSRTVLRTSPKRHFVDPSLAVAALGASANRLLDDVSFLGLLFESLVVRDLRVFAQAIDGEVYHYRDSYGLEVDAVVQLVDGRWAAFEIKLGAGQAADAAVSLLQFARRVDTSRCGEPAVLGVITGTGLGYLRDDGVAVIPIGALAP